MKASPNLPLVLRLQVVHQLVLALKATDAFTVTVTDRALILFRTSLVFLHMAIEVALTVEGLVAASVSAGEATVDDDRRAAGSSGGRLECSTGWCD